MIDGRRSVGSALLAAALLVSAAPASAWFTNGHDKVARAAVEALPPSAPAFFRQGAWAVGQAAIDPDLMKAPAFAALRASEEPLHFLDAELLQGAPLPPDRWAYSDMLQGRHLAPLRVGLLPYAVLEAVQRLTMTFAEHRRWPQDSYIQQKALVYAGVLAHYAADLEQPLHTSVHHDGRALPDGSSPKTGIHALVDGLLERVPLDTATLTRDLGAHAAADPWPLIQAELAASHTLVERVYALEPDLRAAFPPAAHGQPAPRPAAPSADLLAFTKERFRATAAFLDTLFLTAWEQSATVQLPGWLERNAPTPAAAPVAPHGQP